MKVKKCWMVYRDGKEGRKPRYKHESLAEAMAEADRLSRAVPGKYLVVEVIGGVMFCEEHGFRMAQAE